MQEVCVRKKMTFKQWQLTKIVDVWLGYNEVKREAQRVVSKVKKVNVNNGVAG